VLTLVIINKSYAVDIIKMHRPILSEDKRSEHKHEVLVRALEISEQDYGPFTLEFVDVDMTTTRALRSIDTDKIINVFIAAASNDWDSIATPIKVPIRLGQLSYRLLLVNKSNLDKFKTIDSLTELKELTAGVQQGWTINDVFKTTNIKTVQASNFEGLFFMLENNRFDYFPRAIYEAYNELKNRQNIFKDIVVEPTLALYIPSASYVYVSKNEPKIANRLEFGLQKLAKSGELKALFNKYYKEDIIRANLQQRKIIKIKNPYFNEQYIMNNSELWVKP
jgi:hypothetical protein